MSMTRGTRFGPYEIGESIGVGGMGEVYRATDIRLKRDVAIKVLPDAFVDDEQRLARFQREAEVLGSLNHASIAHLYGLERSGAATALVMELVEGVTLAERIAQGRLPPQEAVAVAVQIASALEAAHERGIVHRDLKPANVKLTPDGAIKVLDFGIAKALDSRAGSGAQALTTPAMTEAGFVLGTAAYMAPEQARGQAVDARADIWAFGCVLYELLAGQAAFLGQDTTSTLARVLEREPDLAALPKGLAPNVRTTIELCLKKDPRQRIAHMRDVRLALEGGFESHAPAVPVARNDVAWRRALPVVAVLGTFVLAGAYLLRGPAPDERPLPLAAPLPVTRFFVTPPEGTQLTSLGGYDVVISPDGARVAFWAQDAQTRGVALYVREVDALEARRIPGTETSMFGTLNPFFSPDGRSVGFHSPTEGLLRVSIDGGGAPLKIADPISLFLGAAWAADDTLVYSTGYQLFRVAATGGTPQPLTPDPGPSPTRAMAAPVLLPNGRGVIFGAVENDAESVAVLDLATGEQKVLVEGAQNPMYAATGHLLYARGTTLWAAPFNLAELALTGEPVAMLPGIRDPNTSTAADYAVSASGTLVYVPSGQQDVRRAVVWVDRGGRATQRAVPDALPSPENPRLSPDGTRLLLNTGANLDNELWAYDLRGRPPIPLATTDDNQQGTWSPDGARVAFSAFRGINLNVFVARADGSDLEPGPLFLERLPVLPRDWSSEGELLVVRPFGGNILAVDVDTGAARDVVATGTAENDPAWSPNGRWLAYASSRTGRPEIWVRAYPDGVPQRISANGGIEPRWSADGRELYFLQGNAMMAVAVETDGDFSFGTPVELFTGRYIVNPSQWNSSYDVAADGRFVMIEPLDGDAATANETSFVVVQNWTEELRRRVPTGR